VIFGGDGSPSVFIWTIAPSSYVVERFDESDKITELAELAEAAATVPADVSAGGGEAADTGKIPQIHNAVNIPHIKYINFLLFLIPDTFTPPIV